VNAIKNDDLEAIEQVLLGHPTGASAQQIWAALTTKPALRTLQYRLKHLPDRNRLSFQ
jgi:hypothetical protein